MAFRLVNKNHLRQLCAQAARLDQMLNKVIRRLHKPEYFYRPQQVLKRVQAHFYKDNRVQLPWLSKHFYINPEETIGRSLLTMGVYDLVVSEAFWRLLKPGDRVVDVGANIGYFSCLAAAKNTEVYAFEPHPQIFRTLEKNLTHNNQVHLERAALSDREGESPLYVPKDFANNEGVASLEPQDESHQRMDVTLKTFDSYFSKGKIDLLKIDVEGHELSVLKGAADKLKARDIKNIIFEDFAGVRSPVIQFLKDHGYGVFRLHKGFTGPRLLRVEQGESLPLWEPPNYIASLDEAEIRSTFAPAGWSVLHPVRNELSS